MTIYFILYLVIIASGFALGVSFFKRSSSSVRPVIVYLGLVLALEISSYYMAVIYKNNMPGFHISMPIYFVVIGIFFYRNIVDERVKKTIPWTVAALLLFAIVNAIFFQPLKSFPDNVSKGTTFFYIVWAALLFIQHLDNSAAENIFKNPVFIATIAIMWFNTISLSFFLLYPFMTKHNLPTASVNIIHYFSNYVYYLLLVLSIYLAKVQTNHDRKILQ